MKNKYLNDHILGFKDHILACLLFLMFAVTGFGQKYSNGKQPSGWLPSRLAPHSQLRKSTKPNQVLMSLGDSTLKYVDADTASTIFGAELGWGKEGNAGISKHVNFIGTTDTGSFVIKVDNIKVGEFTGYNRGIGIGVGANATGNFSGVLGWNSTASALGSFVIGENNIASGNYSTCIGTNHQATSNASCCVGHGNTAIGWGSLAMGFESVANGYGSITLGQQCNAVGQWSTAGGYLTTSSGFCSTVFGALNDIDVPVDTNYTTTPSPGNRLFQIGNGTASGGRSNALTVLQSGNIGIGTTTPSTKLDISGGANVSGLRLNGLSNSTTKVIGGNALGYDNSGNVVASDPRPYKVYTALLSHNGTSAPTAVVLENTLGVVPTLSRIGVGEYKISATGLFLANKTFYFLLPSPDGASADIVYGAFRINDNDILITVGTASEYTDNIITAHPIEIRVYN